MNFVIDGVLDGGVNDSLNLDTHGKTLAFLLLSMDVELPPAMAAAAWEGAPQGEAARRSRRTPSRNLRQGD